MDTFGYALVHLVLFVSLWNLKKKNGTFSTFDFFAVLLGYICVFDYAWVNLVLVTLHWVLFNTFGVISLYLLVLFVFFLLYFWLLLRAFGVHLCNWLSVAKLGIRRDKFI